MGKSGLRKVYARFTLDNAERRRGQIAPAYVLRKLIIRMFTHGLRMVYADFAWFTHGFAGLRMVYADFLGLRV